MKLNKLAVIVVIAAVACSAFAQGGGGGRRGGGQRGGGGNQYAPLTLVRNEAVQKELNITDDQKTKITDLQASVRTKSQEARTAAGDDRTAQQEAMRKVNADAVKSLNEILTPEQAKRLRELQIQWTGVGIVATDKDVQTTLGITDDQLTKIKDLQTRQAAANREAQQSANGDRAAITEARTKNEKILIEEINKVLTDAQKAKLAELGGKPMEKPAPPQRGGGGGI
jgi:Spy/CpxP family protein refolding chaperone